MVIVIISGGPMRYALASMQSRLQRVADAVTAV
jgi:hypothetical protein